MTQEDPLGILWVEKYRPTSLDDMALPEDTRRLMISYLEEGEIPHLLLEGPPGTGKTTIARILYNALDCRCLTLNASNERGIDTVRSKIANFVTMQSGARWQVVFLDEADAMTSDAQTSLRNLIESYAEQARFLLTANYPHRIIGPLRSRCQEITLGAPPLKERTRVLLRVLSEEGIEVEPLLALQYAEKYPDMRRMLWAAQRSYFSNNGVLVPPTTASEVDGETLYKHLLTKNWTALRHAAADDGFDPQQSLRELFYAIPDDQPKCGFLRHIIGRGVHESGFSPDPVVLFLGTCAEAMEGL